MKKALILIVILIPLLAASCATTGASLPVGESDRTAALIAALAESPSGERPEERREAVLPTPETVREAEAVPVAEEASAAVEEVLPAPEEAYVEVEEPVNEPEEEVAPQPEPVAVFSDEPEEDSLPVIEVPMEAMAEADGETVPVSGEREESAPLIYPVEEESRSFMDEPMAPWMIRLMMIFIVIIVLFTVSSAIRNAYCAPLSRLASAAIAVLLTALSWVLSYIIAGASAFYPAYLVLLLTYFILRSKGKVSDQQ